MIRWVSEQDHLVERFRRLRREMDELLESFSSGQRRTALPFWSHSRLFPLVNVKESADSVIVTLELPGIVIEKTEVKLDGENLTVRGERPSESVGAQVSYHRRERTCGSFERTIRLPAQVDSHTVTASYRYGLLTIRMNKDEPADTTRISVAS